MSDSNEPRPLTSAYESPTFGEESSFHVDQPVGSMSISPCGRDVVLASKEGLHIIDLDSPYSPPRYLPHHTPWEVADVQWSPFAARDYWVVSTSNQKALVWNLAMQSYQNSIEHVLHAHTRAITDINFSAHHPDILATCAVDSFVHCWDLRTPSRPAISVSDWFAGATQVKWNRQNPHIIASSHDKFLRIWDKRMGAYPIRSIEAHNTKIYGVDWNRVRPGALATCSLDKTIKFWDYTVEDDVPEKVIKTPFPVWRARNTPFGWGVLAMPQRGNSDLHLYSRRAVEGAGPNGNLPPVHSFPRHKGQVKEFLWRARGNVVDGIDHREFQLVSWGTDKELRLHRVDPDVLQRVGYEKGKSFISNLNITRKGAVYRSFRDGNVGAEYEGENPLSPTLQTPVLPPSRGAGVNTISVPYAPAWIQGGNANSRIGMQAKSSLRADTNPISWMRGVKISGWDIETLGDEITHVGEKFKKVAFESVDVRRRKATISLHGPWGVENASLFIRVDIKFPPDYPRDSAPSFSVQKTTAVNDHLASKIVAELQTISETYLAHKRGCLEGVVRYLLGESSLEESIAWILGETAETVKSPTNGQLGGDESSDEDEVGMSQSQDLAMSSELIRPVNANVMVPVARVCGAVWATDGRLVCFFPTKKDNSAYSLENLGFKEMTRLSRSEKVFERFGRFETNSPGPRITGTIASTDDGASEYSDDSEAETSSSSGSSGILSGFQHRFPTPQTWRSAGSFGLYRPRSTDNSQRSTVGGGTTQSSDTAQNVISIHDFSSLLPAKRELASRYRICGKVVDVCAHNASVALDLGYYELAHIWGLVKLILHESKSPRPGFPKNAHRASQIRRKDSAIDLSYDTLNCDKSLQDQGGAVQWGDHPYGGRWLIPALFAHFEQTGDVQMAAMLSCLLYEPNLEQAPSQKVAISKRAGHDPFPIDLYGSSSAGMNKSQAVTPIASTPKDCHATPVTHSSGRSSSELWRTGTTPPYSTGTTPPLLSRSGALAAERKAVTQNPSLAASPDQHSQPLSGSGFGSVLASSLSRSFTFGPSSASPPAAGPLKKKHSSSESPQAPGGSGILAHSAFMAKPVSAIPDYLTTSTAVTSRTHSDTESERPLVPRAKGKVRATLKNQGAFEGQSHSTTVNSFLDSKKDGLYRSYRSTYAHLLSIWGLPVQRSEMLKIGGTTPQSNDSHTHHWGLSSPEGSFSLSSFARGVSVGTAADSESGELGIQRHCVSCGQAQHLSIFAIQDVVDTAVATVKHNPKASTTPIFCSSCKPERPLPLKLPCTICLEVVEGMLTPCLACGHVCCFNCSRDWVSAISDVAHGDDNQEPDSQFCPSGCGCKCADHAVVDIPALWKQPSSPIAESDGSAYKARIEQAERPKSIDYFVSDGQPEDELEHWGASPFASLARGLGGGLSRGLRGGNEDKRKSKTPSSAFVPKKSSMNQVQS
ncbi:Mtc5p [Aspergillus lucknowensis]|uniref:WD repeat protein n=1 Tax=Aspergillus lucknowensis TaxID=176173 RepID=A0ABR4M4K7_9EURO